MASLSTALVMLLVGYCWAVDDGVSTWCRNLPRAGYAHLRRVVLPDNWFEVYAVSPGVYAIYEPHQAEETIAYLILGRRRAVLFDTGMGIGNIRGITTKLTDLPITALNSHTHDDHVGGNWQFDDVESIDTPFTRRNANGSREDAQAEIAPGQICGSLPAGFDSQKYATQRWRIREFIHDGSSLDLGGRLLRVIATPGHTPDSISMWDEVGGLLFTGDTYYPGTIWLYRPETDLEAYYASIRRIAALTPRLKMVLGAHNFPVAEPSVLARLVTSFEKVRAHRIEPKPAGEGKVIFQAGDISFLMRDSQP